MSAFYSVKILTLVSKHDFFIISKIELYKRTLKEIAYEKASKSLSIKIKINDNLTISSLHQILPLHDFLKATEYFNSQIILSRRLNTKAVTLFRL